MFKSLELFRMASAMASHAGQRQGVIATNMANSDTPGYRARDVRPFADLYRSDGAVQMQATRPGHINSASAGSQSIIMTSDSSDTSPNGNSVSLEDQMVKAVDTRGQHDRALAIYRNGLSVLRASLGRR